VSALRDDSVTQKGRGAIRGLCISSVALALTVIKTKSVLPVQAQERVTVYSPHAVNSIVTVTVWLFRTTTAVSLPASNRGAVVQLAL